MKPRWRPTSTDPRGTVTLARREIDPGDGLEPIPVVWPCITVTVRIKDGRSLKQFFHACDRLDIYIRPVDVLAGCEIDPASLYHGRPKDYPPGLESLFRAGSVAVWECLAFTDEVFDRIRDHPAIRSWQFPLDVRVPQIATGSGPETERVSRFLREQRVSRAERLAREETARRERLPAAERMAIDRGETTERHREVPPAGPDKLATNLPKTARRLANRERLRPQTGYGEHRPAPGRMAEPTFAERLREMADSGRWDIPDASRPEFDRMAERVTTADGFTTTVSMLDQAYPI